MLSCFDYKLSSPEMQRSKAKKLTVLINDVASFVEINDWWRGWLHDSNKQLKLHKHETMLRLECCSVIRLIICSPTFWQYENLKTDSQIFSHALEQFCWFHTANKFVLRIKQAFGKLKWAEDGQAQMARLGNLLYNNVYTNCKVGKVQVNSDKQPQADEKRIKNLDEKS